jgi:NAD(P)-dependent dehydrogenase (short-subunit alcohol dehydrogenase family)
MVLVTGGSSGIGRAAVRRFALAGDHVWFTYRSGKERAEELQASLSDAPGQVLAFELDQGDWASHQRLYDHLPGPVDVLVNNAAVGSRTVGHYLNESGEHHQDLAFMRINCVGPLWLCRHVLPAMRERGSGAIINVSSVGGGVATFPTFNIADGMSKAALTYLTRHLAAEVVHTNVTVVAVCPGAVDTPMLHASTLDRMSNHDLREFEACLPRGRLISVEEIAEVIWWLSTDSAAVLHGAVIDASMGLGAHPGLITNLLEQVGH